MALLTFEYDYNRRFFFWGNALHEGGDFCVTANNFSQKPNFLIFLDSRGVSGSFKFSLLEKIIFFLERKQKTYIAINRPLNLTTWATLLNFLKLNNISPECVITNVGFVDFTPKKWSNIQDALYQVEYMSPNSIDGLEDLGEHKDKFSNNIIYRIKYNDIYRENIQNTIARHKTVIIKTPNFPVNAKIKRARPPSFFDGIEETNKFYDSLKNCEKIELGGFTEKESYDGVHYSNSGNEIIFGKLEKFL
jgi:hypothetical protein